MKQNNFLILKLFNCCIAATLLLTACSHDDYLGGHSTSDGAGVVLNATSANVTWTAGDRIGIATSSGFSDASTRNREFVVQSDGVTMTPSSGVGFYVKGNVTLLAYYPFSGSDGAEPQLKLSIDAQGQKLSTDYQLARVDGVTPSNGQNVQLNFTPTFAKMTIAITLVDNETISGYTLDGMATTAYIDPYSFNVNLDEYGTITDDGTQTAITTIALDAIPQAISDGQVKLILKGNNRTYPVVLPAMTIAKGATVNLNASIADGKAIIEYVPQSADWTDSGLGGNVISQ